jgi:hypothetical protein
VDELSISLHGHCQTLTFSHNKLNTPELLRLLADYIEASGATLLSAFFANEMGEDKDSYFESITATVECPWMSPDMYA